MTVFEVLLRLGGSSGAVAVWGGGSACLWELFRAYPTTWPPQPHSMHYESDLASPPCDPCMVHPVTAQLQLDPSTKWFCVSNSTVRTSVSSVLLGRRLASRGLGVGVFAGIQCKSWCVVVTLHDSFVTVFFYFYGLEIMFWMRCWHNLDCMECYCKVNRSLWSLYIVVSYKNSVVDTFLLLETQCPECW